MTAILHCPETTRILMREFLENRGFSLVDAGASLLVCEDRYCPDNRPEAAVVMLYAPGRLAEFDECLKELAQGVGSPQGRDLNRSIIMGKRDDCFEVLKLDDIACFEAVGDETFCRVKSVKFGVKPKLYELERAYADRGFIRIGKPFVVNVAHIAEVVPWFGGKILLRMDDGRETLEVSRNYARQFREFLGMA